MEWSQRKWDYYKTNKKECAVCGTKENLQLHHKTYTNIGKERDRDLVPLCFYHHKKFHDTNRGTSIRKTNQYIIKEKHEIRRIYKHGNEPERDEGSNVAASEETKPPF